MFGVNIPMNGFKATTLGQIATRSGHWATRFRRVNPAIDTPTTETDSATKLANFSGSPKIFLKFIYSIDWI